MWTTDNRLTIECMQNYRAFLKEQERAFHTIQKYMHDLNVFYQWLDGRVVTKNEVLEWKGQIAGAYASASVNSMLAAVNGFLKYMGWKEMTVKPLKIQKKVFCDEDRELTKGEYVRLVQTARKEGREKLCLILQTICATGIRVSELQFITAESIRAGRAEVNNKGKLRTVFLPEKLCRILKKYCRKNGRTSGVVFATRTGKAVDRSNIWREMKQLCESADVEPGKVFPHNLRHLFARTYYAAEKDLSRLADILGHSDINTTRIYTMESGSLHAGRIGRMGFIIT